MYRFPSIEGGVPDAFREAEYRLLSNGAIVQSYSLENDGIQIEINQNTIQTKEHETSKYRSWSDISDSENENDD